MDTFTALGLIDLFGGIALIIVGVFIMGTVSLVWALALKTFKKFPWNYLWILTVSFFIAVKTVWYDFPRVWLGEFKERKKKWREEL